MPRTITTARLARSLAPAALLAIPILPAVTSASANELYLNELYFDPPGSGGDDLYEYVELRGTPGMSLDNHYLLFLESEGQDGGNGTITGATGELDAWFDLSGQSIGSNGFLTLRQSEDFFGNPNPYVVAPGTTDLIQGVPFTGFGTVGSGSTIGWNSDGFKIENGAFSALLINSGETPAQLSVGQDFDQGNDGLDPLPEGWTVIDGIGVAEEGEAQFGRLYAPVNYGAFDGGQPVTSGNVEPGAVFVATDFEIEYVARLGESTGQTAGDWWAANLTDNLRRPGFENLPDNPPDFRLSAADGPQGDQTGDVEASTDQFDYATIVTSHLGAPNIGVAETIGGLVGDYDDSGQVEQSDLNLVLNNWGQVAPFEPNGDAFLSAIVDQEELNRVLNNWGNGEAPPNFAGSPIPEPATAAIALVSVLGLSLRRRSQIAHTKTTCRS
ncbi:MAG: hypothetical protein AAF916_04265 [Planctomycetota bacterium]